MLIAYIFTCYFLSPLNIRSSMTFIFQFFPCYNSNIFSYIHHYFTLNIHMVLNQASYHAINTPSVKGTVICLSHIHRNPNKRQPTLQASSKFGLCYTPCILALILGPIFATRKAVAPFSNIQSSWADQYGSIDT